ncbi:MAG TPA: universal stress protein [Terriglobales bacterium]|nr:universal stress protein [Terriglobales bacterium]
MSQPQALSIPADPHSHTARYRLQRVLVATDFSAPAERALQIAIRWARQYDAELMLVSVVTPVMSAPLPDVTESAWAAVQVEAELLNSTQSRLAGLAHDRPEMQGLRHREYACQGMVAGTIVAAAAELKADLVVVGTSAAGPVRNLLLGSTAQAVIRHCGCPVLLVGPEAESGPSRGSVLLATDLGAESLRPAEFAAAIAADTKARLNLLHVVHDPVPGLEPEMRAEIERAIEGQLRRLSPAGTDTQTRVAYGHAASAIVAAAGESRAGLIVMGVKHETWFGDHAGRSTLAQVAQLAPCPILAVRHHSAETA